MTTTKSGNQEQKHLNLWVARCLIAVDVKN